MESLYAWREFKARQENERMCGEVWTSSHVGKNSVMEIPMPQRSVVIARIRLTELRKREKNVKDDSQRENFRCDVEMWFSWLKKTMKEYRMSKEFLLSYGLCWDDCKRMAFGA